MNAAAAAQGLAPGWKLTDALAVLPGLTTAPAEPEAEAQALEALCDWCVRYSPAVALDPPDGLFLEVSGVEMLFPPSAAAAAGGGGPPNGGGGGDEGYPGITHSERAGSSRQSPPSSRPLHRFAVPLPHASGAGEESLLHDLLARLQAQGFPAFGAIASTPGAAWALARYTPADPPSFRMGLRSAPACGSLPPQGGKGDAARLAPLPVAGLRLDLGAEAGLRRLGLKTIGQVMALPRAQAARRFGQHLLLRLDQATGDIEEALSFRRPPAPFFERLAFAEPISAPEDFARASRDILEKLCARLEAAGCGARRFILTFHRLDGRAFPLSVGTALVGRDPQRLARLFAPKLETVDPGFGVEVVTLEAERVEPLAPRQGAIAEAAAVVAESGAADLVDRLKARLGEDAVWRAEVRESWVPERTVARSAPFAPRSGKRWDPTRPRPLRLFKVPEPIEATAPVPDDPPVQFRWRGRVRRVRAAEGPERIAEEWWRRPIEAVGPERVRDYYRVEDSEGRRFWLFRAGLYGPDAPSRWFVHGLFG